ncbi:MAG: hypothetical protein Q7T48_03670, partial [Cellvibrio sp.]|uniref:hypothetical protein n=1 Tax=Cellvibrio sp. TaxID=1965322 RepID=UPI002720EBC8|nr:hypothetical protein [Cellvibrio sp.]
GKILANGDNTAVNSHGGGGAGGSIWLDIGAINSASGNGEISSNGGSRYGGFIGGGGGGGRIAIYYNTKTGIADSKIKVQGGTGNQQSGGVGTVYFNNKTNETIHPLVINGNGSGSNYATTGISDLSAETHIQINNAAVSLKGINPAVKLDLTNSQVTLADADTLSGELNAQNSVLNFIGNGIINNTTLGLVNTTLNIAGNAEFNRTISLQGGAINVKGDAVFADTVIGSSASTSFISVDGQLTVPGNDLVVDGITLSLAQDHTFTSIHIKNGGVLTTPVASTGFIRGVKITATTITVDEGSRIDVSGKGKVADAATGTYAGGSYGGKGGDYSTANKALETYGDYQQPIDFGLGGSHGGRGGGAIQLIADTLQLEGKILANGDNTAVNSHGGGGAGGSIWLDIGAINSASGNGE